MWSLYITMNIGSFISYSCSAPAPTLIWHNLWIEVDTIETLEMEFVSILNPLPECFSIIRRKESMGSEFLSVRTVRKWSWSDHSGLDSGHERSRRILQFWHVEFWERYEGGRHAMHIFSLKMGQRLARHGQE